MRKSKLVCIAFAFMTVLAISCKRTPKEYIYDAYVVGSEVDGSFGRSMLWVNGTPTKILDKNSVASSVCLSGKDLYISGYQYRNEHLIATLWKNGEREVLNSSGDNSLASSIFVSGKDVYVAGGIRQRDTKKWIAALWKNGTPQVLSDNQSDARSVFVSGNNVYVGGEEFDDGTGKKYPKVWLNGKATKMENKKGFAGVNGIYVVGDDLYAVGQERTDGPVFIAMLWKNGKAEKITNASSDAEANAVFVSGDDIYVAGYKKQGEDKVAVLWTKKGASGRWETKELSMGAESDEAHSLFVIDNNIYVVGQEGKLAMLWTKKAGSDSWEAKELTKGITEAFALSVYVVKRAKKS